MKQKRLFGSIASAMLLGLMALTSCVQTDLYDEFYDDMSSESMIARRKFKNDNGGSGSNMAQSYVSTGSSTGIQIEYKSNYSYDQLCAELRSRTSGTTISNISFWEVTFNSWGEPKVGRQLTPKNSVSITAHAEYSGAIFNDNTGFIAYYSGQSLKIYFTRNYGSYSYAGCSYENRGVSNTRGNYQGTYVHTHPTGNSELSGPDGNFVAGGLTMEAIGAGNDDIASQVSNIEFQ